MADVRPLARYSRRILALAILATLTLALGAGGRGTLGQEATPEATPTPAHFDLSDVLDAFTAAGLTAEATGQAVSQPFLDVPGELVRVEGLDLQVYVYDSVEARASDLTIGPDGAPDPGPTMIIDWIAQPHAIGAGNVLILFISDDLALAEAIRHALAILDPPPGPVATPVPGAVSPAPPRTLEEVVAALEAAGLTVVATEERIESAFFSVAPVVLLVEGERLEVYLYETAADRVAETAQIRGDGSEIGMAIVDFIAPPHWAAANNVLTLLLTQDAALAERVAAAILTLA